MGTPLRPFSRSGDDHPDDSPTSPEALFISALLESGSFDPRKYHVTSDDIEGWGKVFAFCREYHTKAGVAPPLNLVAIRFPEFTVTPGVDVTWAASQVLDASALRQLRTQAYTSITMAKEGDVTAAFDALAKLRRPRGHRREPLSIFDQSAVLDEFSPNRIEVPFHTLMRASEGGIGPGEFWVLAARLGQGKTHIGLEFMAHAAKIGVRCAIAAYEMPARQVNRRLVRKLARNYRNIMVLLDSEDELERKKGVDALRERVPGWVDTYDPSVGRINTTEFVRELCYDYDFVMLDHLGLMQNADGKRAIDDWRIAAWVSNVVREITLETDTPVLGLSQTNRESEHGQNNRPPKASQLSQTDSLGQDADGVVTMRRASARVMRYEAVKLREGPNVGWFSRFDPESNRFDEISKELARDLQVHDTDLEDL